MRVYQLVRQLARQHDVTLLTYVDLARQEHVTELDCPCRLEIVPWRAPPVLAKRLAQLRSLVGLAPYVSRELLLPAMQCAIDALGAERRFDVIQIESCLLGGFRFPGSALLIVNEHNIESEVHARVGALERSPLRRAFSALESARLRHFERACWRRADGVAVTSEREEPLVLAYAPRTATAVVRNGVDLEQFSPGHAETRPTTVVFNGSLDYRPNLDAAQWLVAEIWPRVLQQRPDALLQIVGRGDPRDLAQLAGPSIEVTGEVPAVEPYIAGAAVIAVPVRMGGGTRLKVLEGLAMEKALVSTSLGCEGIDVQDGRDLIVADEAMEFADAILALMGDPGLARRLGRNGRELMEGNYSWDTSGQALAALYARVVAQAA
jgi:glycosyltransferase involved in cell wall biosynthesis